MKKKILCLGGDKRELEVMAHLLEAGYAVTACYTPEAALPPGVSYGTDAAAELATAQACILPVPPLRADGRLHSLSASAVHIDDHLFNCAQPGLPIITGIVTPHLQCIAGNCTLLGLLEAEDIALPLAEATAEGAVAEALRLSEDMLSGASALVIGYGRIGRALSWRLEALGMQVSVLNRGAERAAEARELGFPVGDWSQLTALAARSDYIFNTAPALLLGYDQLRWLKREALIIDLAAVPGGVDFAAAAELGVKAVLAGGLPGKYAPRYCGRVMALAYAKRLAAIFNREEQS